MNVSIDEFKRGLEREKKKKLCREKDEYLAYMEYKFNRTMKQRKQWRKKP